MNDGSEVHYANSLLSAAVDSYLRGKSSRARVFVEGLRDRIIETAVSYRPVIFCLSARPDLLNQWRDYGRDVVPYCVRFNADRLLQNDWAFRCDLVRMIYDEATQMSILALLLDNLDQILRSNLTQALRENQELILDQVVSHVWGTLVHFKNPAFEVEQEWRLLSYSAWLEGQKVQFRSGSLGVTPYYSRTPRHGTNLPVEKVWVGPSPYGKVSEQALQIFLSQKGYGHVETDVSTIPAR